MKKYLPLLLSAVLLSSTVACNKTNDKAAKDSPPVGSNKSAITPYNKDTSSATKNPKATVSAGSTFDTVLDQALSTGKNRNNERFTLRVKNSLVGGNSILKDAQIQGHLEDVVKAVRGKKASLHLVFDDVVLKNGDTYPIDVTLVNTQVETKTKGKFLQNAGIILGGAAAGHFLGNKTKFKHGGLAGGTAAAAYVLSSPGGEVVLKRGTNIKLKLNKPLETSS